MKNSEKQMKAFIGQIFAELKENQLITFKDKEDKVMQRAVEILKEDFQKERELDREVNEMMDDLERTNPGSFQRHKMFPLLKKRLAKEKGVIL